MAYKLIITEKAEELLDNILYHIMFRLKNEQAAVHLISMIDALYDRLEQNPFLYQISNDPYLRRLGYREAPISEMNYKIVYEIADHEVTILGIFHQLEDYPRKL